MACRYQKGTAEVLDYVFNWANWLGVDVISTSTFTATTGITVSSSSKTDTTATAWVTGGTINEEYKLTNRIITTGGRTAERIMYISVEER